MPLHLLGKKSWHVYNKANIERVRRDEADARAAEEAEEQRMQEIDAARRLAILRGEAPPPIDQDEEARQPPDPEASGSGPQSRVGFAGTGERRQRKRHGEDDTDFEMRVAKTREGVVTQARRVTSSSALILDRHGHIDLFGRDGRKDQHAEKNQDTERDKARQRREYEDQYTMRFTNAGIGRSAPWYSSPAGNGGVEQQLVRKNIWGQDDLRRQERDERRRDASDPLAAMKQGAAQVRTLKRERGKAREERDRELREVRRDEHARQRRRSRSPEEEEKRREAVNGRGARRGEDEEHVRRGHRDQYRGRDGCRDERRRRRRSYSQERKRHGWHDEKPHT